MSYLLIKMYEIINLYSPTLCSLKILQLFNGSNINSITTVPKHKVIKIFSALVLPFFDFSSKVSFIS